MIIFEIEIIWVLKTDIVKNWKQKKEKILKKTCIFVTWFQALFSINEKQKIIYFNLSFSSPSSDLRR